MSDDGEKGAFQMHDPNALGERAEVAHADAVYVLEWLRQTNAPPNIIGLGERIVRALAGGKYGGEYELVDEGLRPLDPVD